MHTPSVSTYGGSTSTRRSACGTLSAFGKATAFVVFRLLMLSFSALFDRVLATKLSSKKTKSVFKKWLAFEKQHGDEAGAETVKQRAVGRAPDRSVELVLRFLSLQIAYVQSLQDRE